MVIGADTQRYLRSRSVDVTGSECEARRHCLARSCSFNQTEPLHLAHMLEMWSDETLDDETARMVGTKSSVEALVKFADRMSEIIPEELRKRQKLKK